MHCKHLLLGTADAVEFYVRNCPEQQAVSISQAIRSIRVAVPDCDLTDREIGDAVASEAVALCRVVSFDMTFCEQAR